MDQKYVKKLKSEHWLFYIGMNHEDQFSKAVSDIRDKKPGE